MPRLRHHARVSLAACAAALLLFGAAATARAASISHYVPGLMNLDDFVMPAPEMGELIFAQYNLYYGSNTYRNHNGDKVDKISITGRNGNTVTVDVDIELDLWNLAPLLMWLPSEKVLGARYGAFVVLPFGGPTIGASLDTEIGRGRDLDDSAVGLADMMVQPLWLQWQLGRTDVTTAYAFWAPTGRYDHGETDNTGLGFWGHQIQSALRVPLDASRSLAAILAFTAEVNHNKQGIDVRPGPQMSVNWGLRKNFLDDWLQLGVLGYDSWQLADDAGRDAGPHARRYQDSVHAAGVQLGVPRLGLTAKYMHEYAARDRFEGQIFTLLFGVPLDPVIAWLTGR